MDIIEYFNTMPFGLRVTWGIFMAWGVCLAIYLRSNSFVLRLIAAILFIPLSFVSVFTGLEWGPYFTRDEAAFNAGGHHTDPGPSARILFEIIWPCVAALGVIFGILFIVGLWKERKNGGSRH